jgi:hypothetical protein
MLRWRRDRGLCPPEQVVNANDDFVDLSPVSEVPAEQTRANWSATLSGQEVPLIGEDSRYGDEEVC